VESTSLEGLLVNGSDVYGMSACEPWYNASRYIARRGCLFQSGASFGTASNSVSI
jgi:hypothetical protein